MCQLHARRALDQNKKLLPVQRQFMYFPYIFLTLISVYHSFFHVPPFRLLWLTLFTNVLHQPL